MLNIKLCKLYSVPYKSIILLWETRVLAHVSTLLSFIAVTTAGDLTFQTTSVVLQTSGRVVQH